MRRVIVATNGGVVSQSIAYVNAAASVSVSDVTITEGDVGTLMTFTITRSGGTAEFYINYATSDGSATVADGDYSARSGLLHFDAGVNSQTITVGINGDLKHEPDQAFFFNISNATNGAVITDAQAVGTILNDDANHAPQVNLLSGDVSATAAQSIAVSSLFSGSDFDGDTLTYYLYDANASANSGHFVVNGVTVPAQTIYQVTAAQLAQATFVAGAGGSADDIYVQAYDGTAYSGWNTSVHVAVPGAVNHAPTVNRPAGANVTANAAQALNVSSLFSGSDADNDPLSYFLYDGTPAANSGHWVVNGAIVAAGLIYPVSAAQLPQTTFVRERPALPTNSMSRTSMARPIRAGTPMCMWRSRTTTTRQPSACPPAPM